MNGYIKRTNIYDVIIVGGGISGLYCAYNILKNNPKTKLLLLERSNYLGGRIKTVTLNLRNKGTTNIEAGAARFNNEHILFNKLLKDFKLDKQKIKISNKYLSINKTLDITLDEIIKNINSLNLSDDILINSTLLEIIEKYFDNSMLEHIQNIFPYYSELFILNSKDALQQFKNEFDSKRQYYILKNGMTSIIKKLEHFIKNKKLARIKLNYGVKTINHNHNYNNDNRYIINNELICDTLVLAIPKSSLINLEHLKPIKTLLNTVSCQPLYRIYMRFPHINGKIWFENMPKIITNSPIQFIIPYNEKTGIIMISYTDGKYAKYWFNKLTLSENNNDFFNEIIKQLAKTFKNKEFNVNDIPKPLWIKHYYWENGACYWKKGNYSKKYIDKIIQPSINSKLYICGENYSSRQAWIEGALETSYIVSNKIINNTQNAGGNNKTYTLSQVSKHNKKSDAWLVINKNVYNITNWINKHPGGNIILKGIGKDATSLFNSINHSKNAHNILKKYKIGKLKN